jgi:hypothetical protein
MNGHFAKIYRPNNQLHVDFFNPQGWLMLTKVYASSEFEWAEATGDMEIWVRFGQLP